MKKIYQFVKYINSMNNQTENIDRILQKIYYDPEQGLTIRERFFQKIKKIIPTITRKQIDEFLRKQEVFQQFKKVQQNHNSYFPIYHNAHQPFRRIQIDLMDISAEPKCRAMFVFNCIDT